MSTRYDDATVERVALALRAAADQFGSPVKYYVEPEAWERWMAAHPDDIDKDKSDEEFKDIDWDLESWKLLAVAALDATQPQAPIPIAFAINGDGSELETKEKK